MQDRLPFIFSGGRVGVMHSEALKDSQHEEFCQRRAMSVFSNETPFQTWQEVYGDDDEYEEMSDAQKRKRCASLLALKSTKDKIANLRKGTLASKKKDDAFTADKLMRFVEAIILSPPSAASMDNPYCDLKMSKQGPYAAFPDKLQAAALWAKIKGLAQDVNVSINIPSWSPSSEANICEPVLEGEVIDMLSSPSESSHGRDDCPAEDLAPASGQ